MRPRDYATSDGAGMLIVGAATVARGVSYMPGIMPPTTRSAHVAEALLPMDAWAVVWIGLGLLCLAASVSWRGRLAALAVGCTAALYVLFGSSFILGSITGDMPRGWVSSLGYLTTASLILWAVGRGRRKDREGVVESGEHPR